MTPAKNPISKWIVTGYKHFAFEGFNNFNLKNLSKQAGVARTSFYYLFKDLNDFFSALLDKHLIEIEMLQRTIQLEHTPFSSSYFNLLSNKKYPLLFQKQLLNTPDCDKCKAIYENINQRTVEFFYPIIIQSFHIKMNKVEFKKILPYIIELWYSMLDIHDFSALSLKKYSLQMFYDFGLEINHKLQQKSNSTVK